MTIAELIMEDARARNLRHFFGIPGGGSPLDLMEAGRKSGVDFVSVNHESSAAIMAAYYGLMKDTAGLALTIRGVGAANLVGGAANIHFERAPMVAVCETCPPATAGYEMVQHCDQLSLFSGIERYRGDAFHRECAAGSPGGELPRCRGPAGAGSAQLSRRPGKRGVRSAAPSAGARPGSPRAGA